MTENQALVKLQVLNEKSVSKPTFEKVKITWAKYGEFYSVTATVRGIKTTRMFRYEKDDPRSEFDQFVEQALKIQDDVVKKFEFIYKVKTGQMENIYFNE